MPVTIKRVKGGRTHWAAAVDVRGRVYRWSDAPADAVTVTDELVKQLVGWYGGRGRENAGRLVLTDEAGVFVASVGQDQEGAAAAPAVQPGAEVLAERDEFRKQAVILGEKVEALEAEISDVVGELHRLNGSLGSANDLATSLRAEGEVLRLQLAAETERARALEAKVAELEAIIASAK